MRFAAALSEHPDPVAATKAVVQQVVAPLNGRPCHLAAVFVSSRYRTDWPPVLRHIRQALGNPLLIGCTGGGVLGGDQELEGVPAVSLAAASLPDVALHPFTVTPEELAGGALSADAWREKTGTTPSDQPVGLLLPEPFSCDVMALVGSLNTAYPALPLVGGLASGAEASGTASSGRSHGAQQAGEHALFLNEEVRQDGAVGVFLTGNVRMDTLVAQGCRPIGRPFIVTKAQDQFVLELAGMPATEALRQLFAALAPEDRRLAQRALFLGVVMREQQAEFRRGDFLIRNLLGLDPATGALAVGDQLQVGQTVQFQVRDADTSRQDLQQLLAERRQALTQPPPDGALLFSCLGRGQALYGEPHVDTRMIRAALGTMPIAGFFCNGEIGPVGDRCFVHGFTSSLGLFRPRRVDAAPPPSG